ncbi:STE-domain-containing protein [Fistulina hepatica ATCC 64428]|uniref:STE-domain-containing protein n=1 Tax=Fistulina hepatica ATCC 64428 TaxID=1128425 RepID=A0A0D7A4N1_9AGAR|nr:STE-domain-containing protein [Fistulina hepatica ATCC 64428]
MNYPLDSTSTYPQKRASLGFAGLQVTTSNDDGTDENKIELDPNEYTARPGNAHLHTEFLTGISSAGTSQDADSTPSPEPVPSSTADDLSGLSRPLTVSEKERLGQLDKLKFFLATAPSRWDVTNPSLPQHDTEIGHSHPSLNRFALPSQEYVTCVLWNGIYHITGTDIVRALVFRFEVRYH